MKHICFSDIIAALSVIGTFGAFIALFCMYGSIEANTMTLSDGIKYGAIALLVLILSVVGINSVEEEDVNQYDRL